MLAGWWRRNPERLIEEDAALCALSQEDPPVTRKHRWVRGPDAEPRVQVELALGSRTLELEIRFPHHYPDGCPSVRPIPYETRISGHQYTRSGILCLELGPDNWHPQYTSADMVRSAWRLVLHEVLATLGPHEIPSRELVRLADRLRGADGLLLRTAAFEARLGTLQDEAELEFVWPERNGVRVLPTALPKEEALPGVPPAFDRNGRLTGSFRRLRSEAPRTAPLDRAEFLDFVSAFAAAPISEGALLVLLQWADGTTRGFLLASKILALADMPFATTDRTRTPADFAGRVDEARVAIVGLGSLGSKIGISLARSGVRRFILVDDDILGAENVCRHEADFSDVGAAKVDVVAELIRDVSLVEPEIKRWRVAVAAATNPELHAEVVESIATADLIVDATAAPDAFGLLAMIASNRRLPMVWGEVFAEGTGGFVALAAPEKTPCPRCVRAGFQLAAHAWPAAPHQVRGDPYASGDDDALAATDAAVGLVAAAVTARVQDALRPAELLGPAVTLLGLQARWIFDAPLHSVGVHVRSEEVSCPWCWVAPSAADEDAVARAEALFTDEADADDPPTP